MDLGEFDLTPPEPPPRRPLKRWETALAYLGLLDPDEPDASREELLATAVAVGTVYALLGFLWLLDYLASRR